MAQKKMPCSCILIAAILFCFVQVEVVMSEEHKLKASGTDLTEDQSFVKLDGDDDGKVISIAKRYLRWQSNNIRPTPTGDPFEVRFFKPHQKSERVNLNLNYSGFTLYRRNGQDIEPNTGIFHYVKSGDAAAMAQNCDRGTLHAGAYRYIYGMCPEEDGNLVASGHCHFAGGDLRFNSATFNSIRSYSDKRYYENNNRVMNSVEVNFFTKCFNDWKDAGFSLDYTCKVSASFSVVSDTSYLRRREVASDEGQGATCQDCDFMCSNAQSATFMSFAVTLISTIFLQKAVI